MGGIAPTTTGLLQGRYKQTCRRLDGYTEIKTTRTRSSWEWGGRQMSGKTPMWCAEVGAKRIQKDEEREKLMCRRRGYKYVYGYHEFSANQL